MARQKRKPTLTKRVVVAWMAVLTLSNIFVGIISYTIYKNQLLDARAFEAQDVAVAMALRIDGDKFTDIMSTLEKNDYWYEIKEYADNVAVVFGTAYIYILDGNYTDEVTYFAEGSSDDAPFDLGMTEIIEGIYDERMFETLRTGEPCFTEPYESGEYGDMVSGFAAVTDADGNPVGVVGVDFFYADVERQLRDFSLRLAAVIVAFLVFSYFFMSYMGNKLAGKPLSTLDEAARQMSAGDMDVQYNIRSKSEIGRLADSFTQMIDGIKAQVDALGMLSQGDLTVNVEPRSDRDTMGQAIAQIIANLNEIFGEIRGAAVQVSTGARQIADTAQALAQGTTEQAGAIERLTVSISDVTEKANNNLQTASKTDKLTDAIKSDAEIGSGQMNKMTLAVKDISDASISIGKVIKVIDDIAFQTNILALNAAVEAARAGQHGKGFAVVAEEVRNLAAKSAEAAKDTELLISDSMEKARLGAVIADETAASLNRIIEGVNECAELVGGMASSFGDQISTMREINSGIAQVSQVVQQNSAAAQESAAASEEMSNQSVLLEDMVSQFKLKSDDMRFPHSGDRVKPLPSSFDDAGKY